MKKTATQPLWLRSRPRSIPSGALACYCFVWIFACSLRADDPAPAIDPKTGVLQQVRGLFQNELDVIETLCQPSVEQSQKLVDTVEGQWRLKTRREVAKRLQQHVYGTVDFDGLIERTMQEWVGQQLSPEMAAAYNSELTDRQETRKQALIAKMLVWLQKKLHLSAEQMDQVEKVLNERWKERWYRSVEGTFDNETLLPELNRAWLDTVLTDAQRNALAIRAPQSQTVFASQEYPSVPLTTRLHLGSVTSRVEIDTNLNDDTTPLEGKAGTTKP